MDDMYIYIYAYSHIVLIHIVLIHIIQVVSLINLISQDIIFMRYFSQHKTLNVVNPMTYIFMYTYKTNSR